MRSYDWYLSLTLTKNDSPLRVREVNNLFTNISNKSTFLLGLVLYFLCLKIQNEPPVIMSQKPRAKRQFLGLIMFNLLLRKHYVISLFAVSFFKAYIIFVINVH